MTHETKKAESVDNEDNSLQKEHLKIPPEQKPRSSPKFLNSHDHWNELQDAVSEKDIISLRIQLQEILCNGDGKGLNHRSVFDTTDNLDIDQFLSEWKDVNPDTIKAIDALPRIHIHQHRRSSFENVHHFYVEQVTKPQAEDHDEAGIDPEWELIAEALHERDIIELRESLHQMSSTLSFHGSSSEEIDKYISGMMIRDEQKAFEAEMILNQELQNDVRLNIELREAVSERDIMAVRDQLKRVMQSQHSTSKDLDEIEAYLEDRLDPSRAEAFIAELSENNDLKAVVNLVKDIDKAFTEYDISALRIKLDQLSKSLLQQKIKSLVPLRINKTRRTGMYAAVFVLLTVLSSVIWLSRVEGRKDYEKYFIVPEAVTVFRSNGNLSEAHLDKGLEFYNHADYASALVSFRNVLETEGNNPVAHFYAGASCQKLQQFREAIDHYQSVMNQRDNLYFEQAEWLMVFCLIRISEKKEAVRHLEAIIERKGFYDKDALILLSGIRENDD